MHYANTKDVVSRELKYRDPECFDAPTEPDKVAALELAMPVIDAVVADVTKSYPNGDRLALGIVREKLAEMAQSLHRAMKPWWERVAPESNLPEGETIRSCVLALAVAQVAGFTTTAAFPMLRALVERAVEAAASQVEPIEDAVTLGSWIRFWLVMAARVMQRASACLWTAALISTPGVRSIDSTNINNLSHATDEQVSLYLRALRQFASTISGLNIDPSTLPVGRDAELEAAPLCMVRDFIRKRHAELRRWVHPQASLDTMSSYCERGAEYGEKLIIALEEAGSPDASDPSNWTWRGQEDHVFGEMLCNLHHAFDALGFDYGLAVGQGEDHYESELTEDQM